MTTEQENIRKVIVEFSTEHGPQQEVLWAAVIGPDTARILNVPIDSNVVAFDDHVRLDESGKILEVFKRTTRTRTAIYDASPDKEKAEQDFKMIGDYLRQSNIECESAGLGMTRLAVPHDVSDERLLEICQESPILLTLSK